MSVKVMGQAWELDLPHNKLLVLLAMADHADHEGRHVHPSVALIAWKTGYEERQVRRILRSLEKDGLLEVEKIGGGRTKTTEYCIKLEKGVKKSPFSKKVDILTPNTEKGGHFDMVSIVKVDILTPNVQESGKTLPLKGDIAMSPEPSLRLKTKEEEIHTTCVSSVGTEFPVPTHPANPGTASPVQAPRKPRKFSNPIPLDHWLNGLMAEYREHFNIEALNDMEWWAIMAKSFPDDAFTKNFAALAFADLALWLEANPLRKPRTPQGWKARIKTSLNFYFNAKYSRYASSKPRDTTPQSKLALPQLVH